MVPAKFPLGCPRCIMSPEGRRQLRIVPVVHLVPGLLPPSYSPTCVVVTCPEGNSAQQSQIVLKSVLKKTEGFCDASSAYLTYFLKKKGDNDERERMSE